MFKFHTPATILVTLLFSASVMAETAASGKTSPMLSPTASSQSTIKLEDVNGQKNKVPGDIDEEITNAKLRAESGSKSKFSLSFKGSYTGGSLQSPFGEKRPRLSADPGAQAFTSFDLGLNGRYRWTKHDSLMLGTAFGFVTPFQGRVSKNDALNVNDPTLTYSRVGKILGLQTVAAATYAYGTSIPSRDIDATHQLALTYNMMNATTFGLSYGASVTAFYSLFSTSPGQNPDLHSSAYGFDKRTQYSLGLFPQAEYAISDKVSARTVFGYFNWKHLYGDQSRTRLLQTYVYQSIGIGWAVARDLYLYPNIQFVPDNIRSDFTNVSLSATINVF